MRDANARRKPRAAVVAGPVALLATATAVTLGVVVGAPAAPEPVTASDASASSADVAPRDARSERPVTRSDSRLGADADARKVTVKAPGLLSEPATRAAIKKADTRLWSTADLNLWLGPADSAKQVGELDASSKVLVTGRTSKGREEIVVEGKSRWVTEGYLAKDKPVGVGAGLSDAPCSDSGVESGLTANAVFVYRSVCHAFPQITTYGGYDNHGEHASGRALDIMTSDVALGTAIADFLRAHASELHLYDVLWRQRIWTPVRASEGWRSMPSRGSATANHFDHVHVSTY